MNNITNKHILWIGICLTLLKILLIEYDLPSYEVGYYQPLDEGYYIFQAQHYFEQNNLFGIDPVTVFGSPILTNIVSYFTLTLFGDNFYGLRLSSIFFSLLSVIAFWFLLQRLFQKKWMKLAFMLLLVVSYPFTLSSIVVEPTIARIAFALITLLVSISWFTTTHKSWLFSFGYSFICIFSILFIYPTNAFLVLAIIFVVVLDWLKEQYSLSQFLMKIVFPMSIGVIACVGFYAFFSSIIGESIFDFSRASEYKGRVGLSARLIALNILFLFRANSFLMNPLYAIAYVPATYLIIQYAFRNKDYLILIPSVFCFSFLVQSIFINDFPERKLLVLFPFILLIIAQGIKVLLKTAQASSTLIVLLFVSTIVVLAIQALLVWRFSANFYPISLLFAFITSIVLVILYVKKQQIAPFGIVILCCCMALDGYYLFNYTLHHNNKYYKQAMQQLQQYNGEQFLGGWSLGFMRYNKINADVNYYLHFGEYEQFFHEDGFFSLIDSIAETTTDKEYSIWYGKFNNQYEAIGFQPIDTLLTAEESVYPEDILIYKEK